jgi:hypothetical protein
MLSPPPPKKQMAKLKLNADPGLQCIGRVSGHCFSPHISGISRLNPGIKRPPQKNKGDSHPKLKVVCVTAWASVKDHGFDENCESILV